jgi:starch synthase
MRPEFGMGLDGVLRARADLFRHPERHRLEAWNPATDPFRPYNLRASGATRPRCAPNSACRRRRARLRRRLAADPAEGDRPAARRAARLLGRGGQLIVLGSGEPALEAALAGPRSLSAMSRSGSAMTRRCRGA